MPDAFVGSTIPAQDTGTDILPPPSFFGLNSGISLPSSFTISLLVGQQAFTMLTSVQNQMARQASGVRLCPLE
jgi:hypothetical protein